MQITLSYLEKIRLESRHKMSRNKSECDRLKAILLSGEGWSEEMIAHALRKHKSSIPRHIKEYASTQKTTSNSGGSESFLTKEEAALVVNHLSKTTYFNMNDIQEYIKTTFLIKYSIPGLRKWLHRNKFSYKQLKGVPHKYSQEKQDVFVEEYNEIKATVGSDEPILFMDATHPTQATKVCCGWIHTGTDKPIETTGSRTR